MRVNNVVLARFTVCASLAVSTSSFATTIGLSWQGATGYSASGFFSYDENSGAENDGIISGRGSSILDTPNELTVFSISFFDPLNNLLISYQDNFDFYQYFNFNYVISSNTIPSTGPLTADGFDIGDTFASPSYRLVTQTGGGIAFDEFDANGFVQRLDTGGELVTAPEPETFWLFVPTLVSLRIFQNRRHT